jgi:hypothetical protein
MVPMLLQLLGNLVVWFRRLDLIGNLVRLSFLQSLWHHNV